MIESNFENLHRIVTPEKTDPVIFETNLRPKNLNEYIGQDLLKSNLRIALQACKKRKEALDHVLLHGSPGLGKTTLANIIATELGTGFKITSGPALDKASDLVSIISNLKENDVLFIDEIHRLKAIIEEVLYTAMEDFAIDIIIGKGPTARSMRINLPRFTLIGATTKVSMLSSPLRDRFGNVYNFENYTFDEINKIIIRSANILKIDLSPESSAYLSKCSRFTPRVANRLLKRVRDFAQVKSRDSIDISLLTEALNSLGIDELGLDNKDRIVLKTIAEKFKGGPVGLNTLAVALSDEENTVEDIYEPYLIQLGFLLRTPRGRMLTDNAYRHLKISNILN